MQRENFGSLNFSSRRCNNVCYNSSRKWLTCLRRKDSKPYCSRRKKIAKSVRGLKKKDLKRRDSRKKDLRRLDSRRREKSVRG